MRPNQNISEPVQENREARSKPMTEQQNEADRKTPKSARTARSKRKSDIFDYTERFHNPRMKHRLAAQDQYYRAVTSTPIIIRTRGLAP